MWVEADPHTFVKDQRIAVKYPHEEDLVLGKFEKIGGSYVHFDHAHNGLPLSAFLFGERKFYKWVEEDSHIDQSKLRLNRPNPDRHPNTQAEVEEAESALVQRVAKLEATLSSTVIVGHQAYDLKPGDHLRVWWEDGALWSELVQERTK